MKKFFMTALMIVAMISVSSLSAQARYRHHHYRHAGGSCNGFDRCRCGTTAARYFGLPYDYNGMNLKMAREWFRFPHTSFHVGAAGVVAHHVLAIVGGDSCRSATVHDDAGTHERNVCHMTFVDPNGNGEGQIHRRGHRQQYTEAFPIQQPMP